MAKLAFIGDVHGRVHKMYELVNRVEDSLDYNFDAIIQVGDFHAIRDNHDLERFPVNDMKRELGDFHHYYKKGIVPRPTYFITGNHDNFLWHQEHPNGLTLIENLHYLGRSGVTEIGGKKIGFISGDYSSVGFEGFNRKETKYNYLTRDDVNHLYQSTDSLDVLITHDWPSIRYLSEKVIPNSNPDPYNLQYAIRRNLGSIELFQVIKNLAPQFVFSGHIHMPLDLKMSINGNKVRFIGLDKIRYFENQLYALDTNQDNSQPIKIKSGSLEDVISQNLNLSQGFAFLENCQYTNALDYLHKEIGSNDNAINSLANYGIGVSILKEKNPDFHKSISHLQRSIQLMDHANARIMLQFALRKKRAEEIRLNK